MNSYVTKKYFREISNKMNSYKPLFSSVLSVIENRCKTKETIKKLFFMNNDGEIDENGYLKVVKELKNFFENIYEQLIDKNKNDSENIILKKKSGNMFIDNEFQLENIDKIKDYYINLIKILNELKRSYYERIVSNKKE